MRGGGCGGQRERVRERDREIKARAPRLEGAVVADGGRVERAVGEEGARPARIRRVRRRRRIRGRRARAAAAGLAADDKVEAAGHAGGVTVGWREGGGERVRLCARVKQGEGSCVRVNSRHAL
jgi:hypothetical protein